MKKASSILFAIIAVLVVVSMVYRSFSVRGNELYPTEKSQCESIFSPECNTNPDSINIRIGNRSEYHFCKIKLESQIKFGSVPPGENSCYLFAGITNPISDVLLEINGRDYLVGFGDPPTELKPGNYTYEIQVIDMFNKTLLMWMVED